MSFVAEVTRAQADPRLKQVYDTIQQKFGFLPHYFQAIARVPASVEAQLGLSAALLEDGALSKAVKEEIGLVVSGLNSSSYCIAIHMELLNRLGVDKSVGRKLVTNYPNAPVGEKVQALLRFADKLTRKPMDIEAADAEAVRQAGWNDDALVETVLTVAYFNFINRVSFGLGLVAEF